MSLSGFTLHAFFVSLLLLQIDFRSLWSLQEENEKLKKQMELAKTGVHRPRGNKPTAYMEETQPLITVQMVGGESFNQSV